MHTSHVDGRAAQVSIVGKTPQILATRRRWLQRLQPVRSQQTATDDGYPPGFYVLCCMLVGERFSNYLLFSLLLLYLNEHLGFSQAAAPALIGAWSGLLYLACFGGGMLADRWLGYRRAIQLGGVLAAVGYALMLTEWHGGLWSALACMCAGQGLFKPSLQAAVSKFPLQSDPRGERAFSRIYASVNIGALLGPLAGGLIQRAAGWRAAFTVAAISMLVSALTSFLFGHYLPAAGRSKQLSSTADSQGTRANIRALAFLFGLLVLSGMAFYQYTTVLLLWARDSTDRRLLGWDVPASMFLAVPSGLVIVLMPLLDAMFSALGRRKLEFCTTHKMMMGMGLAAAGYAVLCAAALLGGDAHKVSMCWLLGSYGLLATAELLLEPMGLSLVTQLAPRRMLGLCMGAYFGAGAVGRTAAGALGALWPVCRHSWFFAGLVAVELIALGILRAVRPRLLR